MRINLYDWCKDNNNRLIDEWDCEENGRPMASYTHRSGQYASWVCKLCGHKWSAKICNRTNGSGCPNCANIKAGNRTIEKQLTMNGSLKDSGFTHVDEWDYDKNDIDISMVAISSNQKHWWKCKRCGHGWQASPNSRKRGTGCPVCGALIPNEKKRALHVSENGSFADNYPEFIKYWDFKRNDKSCYELTSFSTYLAHWHCLVCGCEWDRTLAHMAKSKGCPRCIENQFISSIQKKAQDYILSNYRYELRHEKDCSILPKNPKTNYPMPYDNEIIISDDARLIIEVNGEQHYKITEFIKMDARKHQVEPAEELKYLQWKDEYKKQYALSMGYYYLVLPYWTFDDGVYKTLIDDKVQEILNNTKLIT